MRELLVLNGSPHINGVGDEILDQILKISRTDVKLNLCRIREFKINPCTGCLSCIPYPHRCPQNTKEDQAESLLTSISKADLVLFCSPIYFYSLPGITKVLVDRAQRFYMSKESLPPNQTFKPTFVILYAGRTKGQALFTGTLLTLKYFFQALKREIVQELTLRGLENKQYLLNNQDTCRHLKQYLNTYLDI
ncbi:MAG: flavodoxin family protein [Desulfovibrionaceae bacterium]|nr:flavodoxin family protein [Desulfovibrionaceae bacterium]